MSDEVLKAISISLWAFGGVFAFGGFFSLSIDEEKKKWSKAELVDIFALSGFFSAMNNIYNNWGKKKEPTWLAVIGLCFVVTGTAAWILK